MQSIKREILWRVYLSFVIICLVGAAILFRAAKIQRVEGDYYIGKADSLNIRYHTIEAERGNIYSDKRKLLAASYPFFTIAIDPQSSSEKDFYGNVDSLSICLEKAFTKKTASAYKKSMVQARKSGRRYLIIHRNATLPQKEALREFPLFRLGKYRGGLIVEPESRRTSPYGVLAHRTIGYVTDEVHVGIEGWYDEHLSGVQGKQLMHKIAGNTWLPLNDKSEIEPVNGKDIITTIDIHLQDIAENALERALIKHNAEFGTAILMEVATGKIKAIANLTRIDEGKYDERLNYAVGHATEPGSTFKLASVIALIEDGLVTLNDTVDLNKGKIKYYNRTMKDSEPHSRTLVSVKTAFELSSNVGISRLVQQYYGKNPEKFVARLLAMNLDKPTGVTIKGEVTPTIKKDPSNRNTWSGVTLPWMSVGYEVSLTPLQVLNLYNAVANGGKLMRPMLVSAIEEYGDVIEEFKPEVIKDRICSEETIRQVREMLEGVVLQGTAKGFRSRDYSFAGKTGTAQVADKKHGYKDKIYQSSFVGYFPADKPEYSCMVMVNNPTRGGFYGSTVAGPVFREIADKCYSANIQLHKPVNDSIRIASIQLASAKGMTSDINIILDELGYPFEENKQTDWTVTRNRAGQLSCQPIQVSEGAMPDLRGMGIRDALFILENSGLQVKFKGMGKVQKQSLKPGEKINKGQTIWLDLG